jgi:hypothetical protein
VADQDIDQLLAQARPAERTVPLCLRGDLVAEFERLGAEHTKAVDRPATSLADDGPSARALAQQMEALRQQMQDSTLVLTVRALVPHSRYTNLVLAHPPRTDLEGNPVPQDRGDGFNTETFYPALIRACVVDPVMTDDRWNRLDAVLSDRQFDELAIAALAVNRGAVSVPFSPAASRTLQSSEPE